MDRPFGDVSARPTTEALAAALGPRLVNYRALLNLAAAFTQEWNWSKGSGWMLKIHGADKALLYLIPLRNSFRLSLAIRDAERDAFLLDPDLAPLHAKIGEARKFTEGFALAFDIGSDSDFAAARLFIVKLIARRA